MRHFVVRFIDKDSGVALRVLVAHVSPRSVMTSLYSPESPLLIDHVYELVDGRVDIVVRPRILRSAVHEHATVEQIFGTRPTAIECAPEIRVVSKRARHLIDSGEIPLIRWRCPRCCWQIECPANQCLELHACPYCFLPHYLPEDELQDGRYIKFLVDSHIQAKKEFAARERARKTAQREAAECAREQEALRVAREREALESKRQEDARASRIETQRLRRRARLVEFESIETVTPRAVAQVAKAKRLARELASDLNTAIDQNVLAERAVAYGRPTAGAASLGSFIGGFELLGIAFGVLSFGARKLSDDWKRLRAAEFQQKWFKIFNNLDDETKQIMQVVLQEDHAQIAAILKGDGPLGLDAR